jgi:hypothetical protein
MPVPHILMIDRIVFLLTSCTFCLKYSRFEILENKTLWQVANGLDNAAPDGRQCVTKTFFAT